MSLPKKPPVPPRPAAVTIKLTIEGAKRLKTLAKDHNMSQGEVVEYLVNAEFERK